MIKIGRTWLSIVLLIASLLGAGGLYLCFGSGVFVGDRQNQNDNAVEVGIWTSDDTFEQTFIALHPNLSRLDFWVDSYHPWSSPYLECRISELTSTDHASELTYDMIRRQSREVHSVKISGWLISGHMANSCSFEPISDSQGKQYVFSLRSPALKKGGGSILLSSSKDRYDRGSFFVNGEKKDVDLAFRVLYQRPYRQLIRSALNRLVLRKPFPLSKTWFVSLLFLMYLGLVGVLLYSCFLYA
ncbi:hypothetical protein CSA56_07440 [candidate division KSB3 bacterium]|uniref:Uncharacterized protein n=1 Tax=candidate division KSB3 bacterium TaxID=2044937 RepID=A0A2G6KFY4_9BACT|nr:MAG: hypothetical protein CSA56_07440 [candidate division KSB3 bacterium]